MAHRRRTAQPRVPVRQGLGREPRPRTPQVARRQPVARRVVRPVLRLASRRFLRRADHRQVRPGALPNQTMPAAPRSAVQRPTGQANRCCAIVGRPFDLPPMGRRLRSGRALVTDRASPAGPTCRSRRTAPRLAEVSAPVLPTPVARLRLGPPVRWLTAGRASPAIQPDRPVQLWNRRRHRRPPTRRAGEHRPLVRSTRRAAGLRPDRHRWLDEAEPSHRHPMATTEAVPGSTPIAQAKCHLDRSTPVVLRLIRLRFADPTQPRSATRPRRARPEVLPRCAALHLVEPLVVRAQSRHRDRSYLTE